MRMRLDNMTNTVTVNDKPIERAQIYIYIYIYIYILATYFQTLVQSVEMRLNTPMIISALNHGSI